MKTPSLRFSVEACNGPSTRTASKGFTLIELLTVIAIIGILAAILIPVVGSVRESARGAQCASNIRQILGAMHMFAADNEDRFPAVQDEKLHEGTGGPFPTPPVYSKGRNTWHMYLAEYMDVPLTQDSPFGWSDTHTRESTIYDCPTTAGTIIGMPGFSAGRLDPWYSYGMNADLPARAILGVQGSTANRRSGVRVSVDMVETPSRTMAIMETTDWSALYNREITGVGNAVIPHGGGQNVGFYDGSVQRMSLQQLKDTQSTDTFWSGGY